MENEREKVSAAIQRVVMQNEIAKLREEVDDINETLYNDGKGIVFDVRHLKHQAESGAGRAATVINVVSVVISFVVMILMILEKMK